MKKFFEKHDLTKLILISIAFVVVLTWILQSGSYDSGSVVGSMTRTGVADIFLGGMTSVSFFLQQILFVLLVGAFYGILAKTNGYKKLVETIAEKLKGKEIFFVVGASVVLAGLTSIVTNVFVMLLLVPFIIHILHKMNLDKLTIFATTFGSILIGVIGATYGTEGLTSFTYYLKLYGIATINNDLLVRGGILLLAIVLFNFLNITHVKKVLKSNNKEESVEVFKLEASKGKNTKMIPTIIGLVIVLVFIVLGFVDWQADFQITAFQEFHTWLTGLSIGEDYTVLSYILGSNAEVLGSWQLYHMTAIMGLVVLILAIISRLRLDDIIEGFVDGIKNMIKPVLILALLYMVFVFMYWSPIVPTIVNWFLGKSFNPFLSTLAAAIAGFFHVDVGYTGYVLGGLITTYEGEAFNIAILIYTTIHGLVSMIVPTSALLMLGLSYCEVPFKKWFGYIWKFLLGMLICLMVIFTLLTYL